MNIGDLIAHYRTVKSLHSPLPPSLSEKLEHLQRVFGLLDARASSLEIGQAARAAWGNLAPGTMKRYLVQLRAVLNVAYEDALIDYMPRIDTPYVNDVVEVDVTAEQIALLLSYIKWTEPRWYPLVLVLAHTGARLGEAMGLTASNFTRRGVRIDKRVGRRTKTVARTVPYTTLLAREVAFGALNNNVELRLVPNGISERSVAACLGRVLDLSCEALGIPRLRVHDLRHAFAAILAEKGADLADIASALGHTNVQMAMRYRGLVIGRLHAVVAAI